MSAGDTLIGALVAAVFMESPVAVLGDRRRVGLLVRRALERHGLHVARIPCEADVATTALPALPPPNDCDATQVMAILEVQP